MSRKYDGMHWQDIILDLEQRLAKLEQQPVPTETWTDVTSECVWEDDELCHHHGSFCTQVTAENGYRLRKIRYQHFNFGCWYDAFIVEKLK